MRILENVKKYFGADGSDKVLPWIFYRMIESEPFNGSPGAECVKPKFKFNCLCI